jgi:hypothetical protein
MAAEESGSCMWREPGLRRLALRYEHLIDVDEWCEVRRVAHGLPCPAAMTSRLVDAIEKIPFRMVGRTTEVERGSAILRRAAAALERMDAPRHGDRECCVVVGFSARVSACAHDSWHALKLHCGPAEDGKPWLVIGMDDEIGCASCA